jgi:hypothetical protein
MHKLLNFMKRLVLIQNDSLVRMTTEVAETGTRFLCHESLEPSGPTFNHNKYDCAIDPCPICASQMTNSQLLTAIRNLQETVHKGLETLPLT